MPINIRPTNWPWPWRKAQWIAEEGLDGQLALPGPELEEAPAAFVVQPRIGLPPLLRLQAEPEGEQVAPPIRHAVAVPPTVSPSISSVG